MKIIKNLMNLKLTLLQTLQYPISDGVLKLSKLSFSLQQPLATLLSGMFSTVYNKQFFIQN